MSDFITNNSFKAIIISIIFISGLGISYILKGQTVWQGTTSTDWNTAANWTAGLPTSTLDAEIPTQPGGGQFPIISTTGSAACKSLTIDSGASLSIDTLKDISIYGDFTDNGNSDLGKGTVYLYNTNSLGGQIQFENLTVDNSSVVTVNGLVNIAGILLNNGAINTNNNLTLLSNANQTATISGASTGIYNGNVSMQRYISSQTGYHYISSPFNGTTAGDLASYASYGVIWGQNYQFVNPGDAVSSLWYYDETNRSTLPHPDGTWMNGWVAPAGPASTVTPLRGYSLFMNSGTTINLSGTLNAGNIIYNVTYTSSSKPNDDGWNLVGNPYASAVDWNTGWIKVYIKNAFYVYQPLTAYNGQYGTYVNGIGTHNVTNIIPSMQAFFVRSTGARASAPLTVSNVSRRNVLNQTYYKNNKSNRTLVRLNFTSNSTNQLPDETVIYFSDTASSNAKKEFNDNMDAYKLVNSGNRVLNIYSLPDTISYAIKAFLSNFNSDIKIPLGFKSNNAGNHTITATDISNFNSNLHIYIVDAENSIVQDLATNPTFDFTVKENELSSTTRFYINITSGTMTSGIKQNTEQKLLTNAYSYGKNIIVNYFNTENKQVLLYIRDINGQTIDRRNISNGTFKIDIDRAAGQYIIQVISDKNVYTKKVSVIY